jgi:hypothetical protein
MLQIKRLDIICKSKGLPRPKKDHIVGLETSGTTTGGKYVSPYSRSRVSPGANSGTRTKRVGSETGSG